MNEHLRLQSEPVAAPEELGLAATGLERLSSVMQREVENGHVPGISTLIARRGKIGYRRDFGALRTGEFHLIESKLKPSGAEYTTLHSFPFAAGA